MRLKDILLFEMRSNKVGTYYYKPKRDKLPDDMKVLFDKLGNEQRYGGAEYEMQAITNKYSLVWFGHLLEHLGDIIHATSDCVNFDGMIVRDVDRKLSEAMSVLNNMRGNIPEFEQAIQFNCKRHGISKDEFMRDLHRMLDRYIMAHYKLPAYNEVHQICKKMTTSLGAMDFNECKKHVSKLSGWSRDGTLNERTLTITRTAQGNIVRKS